MSFALDKELVTADLNRPELPDLRMRRGHRIPIDDDGSADQRNVRLAVFRRRHSRHQNLRRRRQYVREHGGRLERATALRAGFDFVSSLGKPSEEIVGRQLIERRFSALERQLRQTLTAQTSPADDLEQWAFVRSLDFE